MARRVPEGYHTEMTAWQPPLILAWRILLQDFHLARGIVAHSDSDGC